MIDINSLRIGNWVLHEGLHKQVVAIDSQAELPNLSLKGSVRLPDYIEDYVLGYTGRWSQQVDPILLTIDIMTKVSHPNSSLLEFVKTYEQQKPDQNEYITYFEVRHAKKDMGYFVRIDTLHHLQNLIFELSGLELIYTP